MSPSAPGEAPIALAADHAGVQLKQILADHLRARAAALLDLGGFDLAPTDYPDVAERIGRAVVAGEARCGILLCGSGVGASIAANKLPGVRAGLCHDSYSAAQGVEHDDMNILVLGARVVGPALALELVLAFLGASFSAAPRHVRRLGKVRALEQRAAAALPIAGVPPS